MKEIYMKYIFIILLFSLQDFSLNGSQKDVPGGHKNIQHESLGARLAALDPTQRAHALQAMGYIPFQAQPVAPRVPTAAALAQDDAKTAPANMNGSSEKK
jgi:hypothetical protein